MPAAGTAAPRGPSGALLAAFVLAGVATTLAGPLLPWFAARWGLQDRQLGAFFVVQFLASLGGVLLSGLLLPRGRFRLLLVSGLLLLAGGVSALALDTMAVALGAVGCYGLGLGLVIPTGNLLTARQAAPDSAAALNLLNFAWGVGAVASSGLVALALRQPHPGAVLVAFGGACGLAAAAAWAGHPAGGATFDLPSPRRARRRSGAWLALALLFFLYVGVENVIGGWIAALARRMGLGGALWLLPAALFWAGLLGGRVTAPLVLRRIPSLRLARWAMALALGGMAALAGLFAARAAGGRASSALWIDASAFLCGAGLSVVFPEIVSLLSPGRPEARPPAMAEPLLFVPAALGGAVLPWLFGAISQQTGGPLVALVVPIAGGLGIFFALPACARRRRAAAAAAAGG
ncbi:MAG TPA: MFS transporter [Terriglobales bacterium]|nr:MFS transporter [Terriglobales bacterium]